MFCRKEDDLWFLQASHDCLKKSTVKWTRPDDALRAKRRLFFLLSYLNTFTSMRLRFFIIYFLFKIIPIKTDFGALGKYAPRPEGEISHWATLPSLTHEFRTKNNFSFNVFAVDISPYVSTGCLLCMPPRVYYVYSLGGLSKLDGSGMESPDRGKDVCTTLVPWYKRGRLPRRLGEAPLLSSNFVSQPGEHK